MALPADRAADPSHGAGQRKLTRKQRLAAANAELANTIDRYDLSLRGAVPKPDGDRSLLDEAVVRLVEALAPERIYLFGSRARGDACDDSDYDLMVVVPYDVARPYELEQRALACLWGIHLPVEPLVMARDRFDRLARVAASLPATIEREGQILYAA